MATQEYECPACGGVMEFDAPSQKLKCLYCDTAITVEEYKKIVYIVWYYEVILNYSKSLIIYENLRNLYLIWKFGIFGICFVKIV